MVIRELPSAATDLTEGPASDAPPRTVGRRRLRRAVVGTALFAGLPAALFALWWALSAGSTSFFFPPLSRIVDTFGTTWTPTRIGQDVLPSLVRLLAGFALAGVVGIALGVLIGSVPRLAWALGPTLAFLRAVPPPLLVPAIMLVLGIGDGMRITVVAVGCVWPVLLNTVDGVRSIDPLARDTVAGLHLSAVQRLRHLVLPAAGPRIAAGLEQALSLALVMVVISEMFAARDGLGRSILVFSQTFAIPAMWSGILLLGVLGILLAFGFRAVQRWALAWWFGATGAVR
ncbi:ABC transporter permease [Nakamurella leprariae]|uniref:ABC transporter permease subunit n=1 Tax=Nakamurella leprariae TaxID=2803911 RepID=A0A939C0P3_9ACTN|nr:ABC transporter permease subunit [Nakamurella leprariae]MBM9468986.1 ABC transporter permease subunit [Nakamurella leprariae]